jgi:hypothetical protein
LLTDEAESNDSNNTEDNDNSFIIHISEVSTYRSAFNSLFRIIFGFSPADSYPSKLLSKTFNSQHPKQPRFEDSWNVTEILSRFNIREIPTIFDLSTFKNLQAKTAVLISFFTLLRPSEITLLSIENAKELPDGFQIFIVIKTNKEVKTSIFIQN